MKSITYTFKTFFTLFLFVCGTTSLYAQTITTTSVNSTVICRGGLIKVSFVTNGNFQAGSYFKIQLSNASGVFSGNYLGELELQNSTSNNSVVTRTITGEIQTSIAPGNGYKVRVVHFVNSNTPAVIGTTNSSNISIVASKVTPSFSLPTSICSGTPFTLPTTSTNEVAGTWSPSFNNIVSTNTTTNYIFTPSTGYCSSKASKTITVNANVTPTFNAVEAVCSGKTMSALPTQSTNNVSGTWSPTLNNTQTTTYTFTPAAGLCALTKTMTVVVNPRTTPSFNELTPICAGASISNLPQTSLNGIAGTWSPPVINNHQTTSYTFTPNNDFCASLKSETLIVNPNITSDTTVVSCLSFTWPANGQTYTESGTYTYVSDCTTRNLNLTITQPSTLTSPSTINGTAVGLCLNGIINPTFSVLAVSGATSYTWTAPIGTSIVTGQGTTSVTLEVSSSFVSGTLSVIANNLCGSSTAKTLALSSIPPAPGIITGASNNLCLNGVSNPTYTILAVAGASSYTWTAPVGTTIVSGQGTTSVTLEVSGSFVSGNLSVIANNQCGSSTAKTLALSSIPPAPGIITGPSNNLCLNGVSNPTYTISTVAGASSYTWTAPIGTTIVSGQGTTSVTLAVSGSFVSGPLSVKSNNSCSSSISRTLALYSVPLTPGLISGETNNLCPNGVSNLAYTILAVGGASSYTWTAPIGTTILSGQGTTSVTLEVSSSFVSGSLSVVANNLCGSSSAKTLVLSSTPFASGTITGTSNNLCPNGVSNPTYSIAVVAGASSYTWTAPVGTSIVSGQGTTSVTLEVSSSFVSGTLSVIANNLCGSSTAKSLALSSIPPAPGIITGASNNLCLNGVSNPTYTILAVAGASSYTWTAPVGTTIVSGQGTTSVTLEVSGSFVSGNLSVIANNQCGSSTAKTLALSSIPPPPGIITGPSNNLCLNGVSNPTYTISAVAGASSYTWTAPIGTTIVSGQGTTSVTLAVSGSFVSGPLTVKSNNSCSSSISRTLALYSVPLTPASITGSAAPCGTTTYSCAAVSQAVSYTWTVPAGLEIESGQGTNTITVNVVSSNVTGSITVKASNNCKTGAAKSMVVSSCTSKSMLTSTEETITNNNTSKIEAIVYPNPTNGEVNIEFSSELESDVKVELYDMIGNKVSRVGILAGNTIGNLTLEDMTSGMYFLQVVNSNNDIIYKSKVSKQ